MLNITPSVGHINELCTPIVEVRGQMIKCEFTVKVSINGGVLSGKALSGMRREGEILIRPIIGIPVSIEIEDLYGEQGLSKHIEYDFLYTPDSRDNFHFISNIRQYVADIKRNDYTYNQFSDQQLSYISIMLHNTVANCITSFLT